MDHLPLGDLLTVIISLAAIGFSHWHLKSQIKADRRTSSFATAIEAPVNDDIERLEALISDIKRWRRRPTKDGAEDLRDQIVQACRSLNRHLTDAAAAGPKNKMLWLEIDADDAIVCADALSHEHPINTSAALEGALTRLVEAVSESLRQARVAHLNAS